MQTRPTLVSLICGSCPSDRDFASDFLQIPPHDGHPYLWLVVPTTKPTTNFHRQVVAHAGHTKKRAKQVSCLTLVFIRLSPLNNSNTLLNIMLSQLANIYLYLYAKYFNIQINFLSYDNILLMIYSQYSHKQI